ncbi:unnamed protein product [Adineta ricciae]|uniref:Uncharacterized protein n=1 Tax=Adineta ricciae TaxID=249248 RepID=A0A814AY32_ADIRI|nr:unnamed protein product [Adineta ricciae]
MKMHLSWIDYGVSSIVLILSGGIGIHYACKRSKPTSTKEYLIADGQMKILPTAMSLLASFTSAISLLGTPVEIYYYGTMYVYSIFAWLIATLVTVKFFIPKFHYVGSVSIYAYFEKRFSLAVRILITCDYILVTILYISVALYGPCLAVSQVTGINIWMALVTCGVICTIYTSIVCLIDIGGLSKAFDILRDGNRIQFAVINFNPSIRYTIWSILIGHTFATIAQYACIQTQAQRYMCVKDTKAAQKVMWNAYIMNVIMYMFCIFIGCLLYAKYSQCDPLRAKLISRSDQMYPLFIIETLSRFPGLPGLWIASILSATLSTFSSGVNSLTTVIIEDIYKRLAKKRSTSADRELIISKVLSTAIGFLIILVTFVVSYTKNNIITIVIRINGTFSSPILGAYLLGFFSSRVKSRSILAAICLCFIFQTFILVGSMITVPPTDQHGGRLPTSVNKCVPSVNDTMPLTRNQRLSLLESLFSISPLWFNFNGTIMMIISGLIFTFIFDSNDTKEIDRSLLVSRKKIVSCQQTMERSDTHHNGEILLTDVVIEEEN